MPTDREILTTAYDAFNARDIERALATMHPDVDWPNGMKGGYMHGHRAVRAYWTGQWAMIDPRVEPLRFEVAEAGRIVVDVRQVVRDLAGNIKLDHIVQHVYEMRDQLITSMEIVSPSPPPPSSPSRTTPTGTDRGRAPGASRS